jgi:hypothetical protein
MYIVNKILVAIGCIFFGVHFAFILLLLSIYTLVRSLWSYLTVRKRTSLNPIRETHPDVFRDSSNIYCNSVEMITQ